MTTEGIITISEPHQIMLEVAPSVTEQIISTSEPCLAKILGAPSIFVTGTRGEKR